MIGYKSNTYFFDAFVALEEAKKQHKVKTGHPYIDALQICYYDGPILENTPDNCINVSIENLYDYFLYTKNRFPENINFAGKEFSAPIKQQLAEGILQVFESVVNRRHQLEAELTYEAKKMVPDFTNGFKVFLMANRLTTVMQYVSKNIADTLKKMGHEVFLSIEENDMQTLNNIHHLQAYLDFRPNITFNINYMDNTHLHENIINFVWFQDYMPEINNNETIIQQRKNDIIYSLVSTLDEKLLRNNLSYSRQPFCINTSIFRKTDHIQRESKIVFIGSSYHKKIRAEHFNSGLLEETVKLFRNGVLFTKKIIKNLSRTHNVEQEYLNNAFIPFVVRDVSTLLLFDVYQSTGISIEIYGEGWDQYESLRPFCKGLLPYDKIVDVYNSAEYALVPHSQYVLQQRTLEAAACGCQPIVYDCRYNDSPPFYEDALEYFQTLDQIIQIIRQKSKKDLHRIVEENSYEHLIKRIIATAKNRIKNA